MDFKPIECYTAPRNGTRAQLARIEMAIVSSIVREGKHDLISP